MLSEGKSGWRHPPEQERILKDTSNEKMAPSNARIQSSFLEVRFRKWSMFFIIALRNAGKRAQKCLHVQQKSQRNQS